MINVLHLATGFGRGGAELNLARLVCNMDKYRFSSTVVSMRSRYDGPMVQRLMMAGVGFRCLEMRAGMPDPLAFVRLLRIVREVRPHVLQTWMYHADLLGLLVAKLARVPIILWYLQCSLLDMTKYRHLSGLVLRALIPLSRVPNAVLANSQAGVRFHRELGYKPKKWICIPNSLDLNEFKPDLEARRRIREELRVGEDALLVGLVARLDPMKDHATFVRAARLIASEDPRVRFVLVGEGADPTNQELLSLIRSEGMKTRFHLMGLRDDVSSITAALDIACSSSYGEGFSNTISEAMACAVPCVVTDVGDSALLVGDSGRVVPPRNPSAFAKACRELLALPPRCRLALGIQARRSVEDLSTPSVVAQYQQLYDGFVHQLDL